MGRAFRLRFSVLLVLWSGHWATTLAQEKTPIVDWTVSGYFESIRHSPPQLRIFLQKLPKDADLHTHLSGAVYAESFIRWATDEGLCVDDRTYDLAKCNGKGTTPEAEPFRGTEAGGSIPAWTPPRSNGSPETGWNTAFYRAKASGEMPHERRRSSRSAVPMTSGAARSHLTPVARTFWMPTNVLACSGSWSCHLRLLRRR